MRYFDAEPMVRMPVELRDLIKRGELPSPHRSSDEARRAMVRIDPGYSYLAGSKLSDPTRALIREIRGIPDDRGYYWNNFYGCELKGPQKLSIARAMVLTDALKDRQDTPGRLDEIALEGFSKVFEDYAGEKILKFRSPHGFDQDLQEYGQRLRRILSDYLEPRPVWEQKIDGLLERKRVYLTLGHLGGELGWKVRGPSKIRLEDKVLVEKLNRVLTDYRMRLQLKEDYLLGTPLPGLDGQEMKELKGALQIYYRSDFDTSMFRSGISMGDDFVELQGNNSTSRARAYIARCISCSYPSRVEVLYIHSRYGRNSSWDNDGDVFSVGQPDNQISRVLSRFHSRTGCSETTALSSRKGKKLRVI